MQKKRKKLAAIALCVCAATAFAVSGCATKLNNPTLAESTEAEQAKLQLSYYMTGCETFTDADGAEKTSFRFIVKNDDPSNAEWTTQFANKEEVKVGDTVTQVYSQYLNDSIRFVDVTLDGKVEPKNITYTAGDYKNDKWDQAGEDLYKEIGAINEDGTLYFYNGVGRSTGVTGDKKTCIWLAGFTADTVSEDGTHPKITSTDHFSLVDADGKELTGINGSTADPQLIANEYGVEIMIDASDDTAVTNAVAATGMVLRHTSEDGVKTKFMLEKKREITETEMAAETTEAEAEPEDTVDAVSAVADNAEESPEAAENADAPVTESEGE